MSRQIVVDIIGDASKFTKATKEATGSASKFGQLFGTGFGVGAGIGAFDLMSTAVSKTTEYLTDAVAAAREEEVGIVRLGASLRANVAGWDGNTDAIEKQINAMVRSTGFSDGEMRDSLTKLVAATGNTEDAFRLQATAMDLARFKGVDLVSASEALVKVEAGQYRALKELGIVLKEGATQTEALAAVQKVAGGQMAAYMETSAGKADVLKNRFDDLQETIGGKLVPVLNDGSDKLLKFMDAMDSDVPMSFQDRVIDITDVLNDMNPMLWGTKAAQDEVNKSLDRAQREAAAAARDLDTYSEAGAAARERTYNLRSGVNATGSAFARTADEIAAATRRLNQWARASGGSPTRPIDHKAAGGPAAGLTWVGEQGPELVNLPSGSYVNTASRSRQMATGSGSGVTVVVNGNIYGPSGVDELMDMMARRLRLDGV